MIMCFVFLKLGEYSDIQIALGLASKWLDYGIIDGVIGITSVCAYFKTVNK